ncbi:MAG: DUF2336 domain-containing protein, partial [Proteobacteria bacterium]|nr:DUF2336 domain-containing protein [Pseudomonadota bacterium]
MFAFFRKIFGVDKRRYERQKKLLETGNTEQRQLLANGEDTHPEVLYFLARDTNTNIRLAAATNKSTPVQASALLANDKSVDVRMALAARLVGLLPDLSTEKHGQLYAYAVQALGVLAKDEVLKIRQALSGALKDHAKAPPKVVGQLARDVERTVSEPILRFCIALEDDDLLSILGNHPETWVISAIARRPIVSARVSDAVIDIKNVSASAELLHNKGAMFSEVTLQKIIESASEYPEWHEPLAVRKELSLDLAQKLAGFVSASILDLLEKRSDFEPAMRQEITELVRRRIEFHRHGAPYEAPESKVERYVKTGKLTPSVVQDALAWQDHKFVLLALAYLSKIHPIVVEKMLRSGSAKPIISLCWKARMPMRVALELQRNYARLQPKEFMYAKGGTDYPMSLAEIKWQLEFYGVDLSAADK